MELLFTRYTASTEGCHSKPDDQPNEGISDLFVVLQFWVDSNPMN